MFRRLYWIAEQVDDAGQSRVTGVYTSIQDLVHQGLNWSEASAGRTLRLSLVKPDTFDTPFGTWSSPSFEGLATDIRAFVNSQEYSEEETAMLMEALHGFVA